MPGALRVMTYNVRGLRDDVAAVVEVIRSADPDVLALQEPPRGPTGRSRLRRLAHAAGLVPVVSGGGARSTALLARPGLTVTGARALRLRWRIGRIRRGLSVAEVEGVRVVSTHLALGAPERVRQVDPLLRVVAGAVGGCVVAGDLNEEPGGPAWQRLRTRLHDLTPGTGPTFSARRPRRRIDAVLATGGLVGEGARAIRDDRTRRASDHLPVVVDVRWV